MQIKQKPVERECLGQTRNLRLFKIEVLDVLRMIDVQSEHGAEVIDTNNRVGVRAR